MKRVKGIGGIFFKTKDPEKSKEWYQKHLGINSGKYGGTFQWKKSDDEGFGHSAWGPFSDKTEYFNPSNKEIMINYRVENLVELLETLKSEGVEVVGEMEEYDYGKFGWIMDPDGYKIELWEPNDEVYGKYLESLNKSN